MRRTKKVALANTTIAVFLSLNIQVIRDNGRAHLFTLPLVSLSSLVLWLWQTAAFIQQVGQFITQVCGQVKTMMTLTNIGFKSVMFGVGLSL